MSRTCNKCGVEESDEHPFAQRNWRVCVECSKAYQRQKQKEYFKRHSEKEKERHKEYYEGHRDQIMDYGQQWRAKNPEKPREYARRQRRKKKQQPPQE